MDAMNDNTALTFINEVLQTLLTFFGDFFRQVLAAFLF